MRKLIGLIIVLVFVFLITINGEEVNADTFIEGEGLSGGSSATNSCQSSDQKPLWCYGIELLNNRSGLIQGIRITVVDKNGNRISGTESVDFIKDNKYVDGSQYTIGQAINNRHGYEKGIYFANVKRSRVEILNGSNISAVNSQSGAKYKYTLLSPGQTWVFPDYLTKTGTTTNLVSFFTNKSKIDFDKFNEQYLSKTGYDYKKYINKDSSGVEIYKSHYVIIEPIAYYSILYGNDDIKRYIGTVTEIFKMMSNHTIMGPNNTSWSVSLIVNQFYSGTPYINNLLPMAMYLPEGKFGLSGISHSSNQFFTVGPVGSCHPDATGKNVDGRERCKERTGKVTYVNMFSKTTASMNLLYLKDLVKTCAEKNLSDSDFLPECCTDNRAPMHKDYRFYCGGGGDEYPCSESSLGIKTRLIGNCVSATQTKIVQTDNWNVCLFTGKVSSAELSISYCNVFCREEVETDLQNRYPTVKAGNHFTLDSMSIKGMKECRAKIDLEGLDKARENAISQMRSAYDTLQYEKAMQKISYYKDGTCDGECIEYECPSGYTLSGTSCQKDILDEDGKKIGTDTKSATCKRYRQYDYYKPTPSSVTYYDSYGRAKSASKSSYCSYRGSAYQSKLSSAQSSYNQASSTMERVIENIRNCAGWVESIRYNFSPNLSLEFEYLGERRITMNKDLSESRRVKYYTSSGLQTSKITVTKQKLVCPGDGGCSLSNVSNLPWNEVVATEVDKNVYYSLPVNTFRYVDKVNIQSKDTPSSNGLSYDIGYPNIPVHYLTKEGEYPIKLLYSNLGENGKFDSYLSTIQGYGVYECKYKVIPGPVEDCPNCPTPGMAEYTFVYRTIDLNNPFPGKNGSGRQVGANWQNNKNIISADTFNKAPMYKITLNSKAIKTIRDYNKQNPYDDFKMICENGSNCKSNFLRNEIRQYVSILEGSR